MTYEKWRTYDEVFIKSHVTITKEGCWEWDGPRDKHGYGQVNRICSGESLVHRLAYTIFVGPPEDNLVRHTCHNPPCCNPKHLKLGSQVDNMGDAIKRGTFYFKPVTKLTPEVIEGVKSELKKNRKQKDIAKQFGITPSSVTKIKHSLTESNTNG